MPSCSTSCFRSPSYAYLTLRYDAAANPLQPMDQTNSTKVQYFFMFKSVIAPICFLAIFGDTLRRAGGTVSNSAVISKPTSLGGSALGWAFFASE